MSTYPNIDDIYAKFVSSLKSVGHNKFMHLKILPKNTELSQVYLEAAANHNQKIIHDAKYYDSGFDLYLPVATEFLKGTNKVDFGVKCSGEIVDIEKDKRFYTGYYTYARSSISKTPLRLANNQGIIDAGYRGPIIGMFDLVHQVENCEAEVLTRLIQICAPNLMPIYVEIVNDLDTNTSRGEGGIGSTGV
jgi:dUTP pyrophosphatase